MTTVLFDTDAMIRVGRQLRTYGRVTDPIAGSMGRVPAGLAPGIGDVTGECRRLDMGVRALGELVEGMGAFAVALASRVKAADLQGDKEQAINLARLALLHMPMGHSSAAANKVFAQLRDRWPEVYNSVQDIKSAKAVDELLRGLSPTKLHNFDARTEWRRLHPTGPIPNSLRELEKTLKGAGAVSELLQYGGIAASVAVQALMDLNRDDLTPAQKIFRAAQAGLIDVAAGRAGAAGVRVITLTKWGAKLIRGPWGWLASGLGAIATAVGADKAGNIISGEFLFESNPNDKSRMNLPTAIRSRIEAEGRGPYRWPEITQPTPEMRKLLVEAQRQEGRIGDLYSRMYANEPIDPVEYRRSAYDLIAELDRRRAIADRLEALQEAKR